MIIKSSAIALWVCILNVIATSPEGSITNPFITGNIERITRNSEKKGYNQPKEHWYLDFFSNGN